MLNCRGQPFLPQCTGQHMRRYDTEEGEETRFLPSFIENVQKCQQIPVFSKILFMCHVFPWIPDRFMNLVGTSIYNLLVILLALNYHFYQTFLFSSLDPLYLYGAPVVSLLISILNTHMLLSKDLLTFKARTNIDISNDFSIHLCIRLKWHVSNEKLQINWIEKGAMTWKLIVLKLNSCKANQKTRAPPTHK